MQDKDERQVCFIGDQPHPGDLALTKYCLNQCQLPDKAKILDVGCGFGQTVRYLRDLSYQAFGMDVDMRKLDPVGNGGSGFSMANWFQIPFANIFFDVILAECTFSLIGCLDLHLSEIFRVLKPKGILIFHGLYSRRDDYDLWLNKIGENCSLNHIRNQEQLLAEVENAGFTVEFWEDQSKRLNNNKGFLNNLCWSTRLFGKTNSQGSDNQQNTDHDIFDFFLTIAKLKLGYYVAIASRYSEVN